MTPIRSRLELGQIDLFAQLHGCLCHIAKQGGNANYCNRSASPAAKLTLTQLRNGGMAPEHQAAKFVR